MPRLHELANAYGLVAAPTEIFEIAPRVPGSAPTVLADIDRPFIDFRREGVICAVPTIATRIRLK